MKLKPYKKTKPSGVEWLGDVPGHWEHKRFGYLFRFFSGGTPSTSESELWDGDLPWVSSKDMKTMVIADTEDHISEDAVRLSAATKVPSGSLLMVNRSGILKHSIPVAVTMREMAINQDIRGCVPFSGTDAKFFAYLIHGNQKQLLPLWRQQGATVESLSFEAVKTSRLYIPTLPEQRAIAAYLEREIWRIDLLVAKKRELIERLKEKRSALISRTVTRGLPPAAAKAAGLPVNPKMKESGIEWIGEIPRSWGLEKMSHICLSIRDGTHNPPDRADGIHRLLSVRNVQEGKFALLDDDRTMTPEDFADLQRSYTVEEGDIVLAIVGATTGKSAIVGKLENVTVQRSLAILRPNHEVVSSSFLHYVIQSPVVQTEIQLTVFKYSAQPGIYLNDIGQLRIVAPPLPEQTAIATYLDAETTKLDALVAKVEEAVERLQEYRSALITAAVTGKIDVRSAASSFPTKP